MSRSRSKAPVRKTHTEKVKRRLTSIPGIGPTLASQLIAQGTTTRSQLRRAGVIEKLPKEAQIHLRYKIETKTKLRKAEALAKELRKKLVFYVRGAPVRLKIISVGSIRRKLSSIKDIDLLIVVPPKYSSSLDTILKTAKLRSSKTIEAAESYATGKKRHSFVVREKPHRYYKVDLFLAQEKEKPYALFHYTGDKTFNIRTRAHAKRRGWLLNQYGLFISNGKKKRRVRGTKTIRSEGELFKFLGVTYRRPPERSEEKSRRVRPKKRKRKSASTRSK